MTLENFLKNMKKTRYPKEVVSEIDGRTYFYDAYSQYIYDVTGYEQEENQIIHSNLERHINKKVDVINFVRDTREDCFDDGGFCFYVGRYNNRFVLGSNYISYNNEFSDEFLTIDGLEEGDENIEYRYFDSLEEIDSFIEKLFIHIERELEDDEDMGCVPWEYDPERYDDVFIHQCLKNLGMAYVEFSEEDSEKLKKLTTEGIYKPNFIDPSSYYEHWIDENDLEPILVLK